MSPTVIRSLTHRAAAAFLPAAVCFAPAAHAQAAAGDDYRWLTFTVFGVIIALTMYVTWLASKRVRSASDFYTAVESVPFKTAGPFRAITSLRRPSSASQA